MKPTLLVLVLAIALVACGSWPTTFPDRLGPGTSPMTGGVSCHSMLDHALGCTEWDGHHTLQVSGVPVRFYSDLGPRFGSIGPWHEITEEQAATWDEGRGWPAIRWYAEPRP